MPTQPLSFCALPILCRDGNCTEMPHTTWQNSLIISLQAASLPCVPFFVSSLQWFSRIMWQLLGPSPRSLVICCGPLRPGESVTSCMNLGAAQALHISVLVSLRDYSHSLTPLQASDRTDWQTDPSDHNTCCPIIWRARIDQKDDEEGKGERNWVEVAQLAYEL